MFTRKQLPEKKGGDSQKGRSGKSGAGGRQAAASRQSISSRLSRTLGNEQLGRLIQTKLEVSEPGDRYEQEADRLARQVMEDETSQAPVRVQRLGGEKGGPVPPGVESTIEQNRGSGVRLGPDVRQPIETALGADFSEVRVHADRGAGELNESLNSRAFTLGSDIFFGSNEYRPGSPAGRSLLAHELVHVLQQGGGRASGRTLQREQPAAAPAAAPATHGTITDLIFLVENPSMEADVGLRQALGLFSRYSAHVTIQNVDFRVLPESERRSHLDTRFRLHGQSFWDGTTPVIRLPQQAFDIALRHIEGNADIAEVHGIYRTIGHEMYHLYRAKIGHTGNPVQPLFETEAASRLQQVRQNWLRAIQAGTERIAGVPQTITSWEQIPQAERERIEAGASSTDYIQGFYERTAYLVEEMYVLVEELSYLRVQQRQEGDRRRSPSRTEVSNIAQRIYYLNNRLRSMIDPAGLITQAVYDSVGPAMLAHLRSRYPGPNSSRDSFEVLFFFNARECGLPPLVDSSGRLQTPVPPGVRWSNTP